MPDADGIVLILRTIAPFAFAALLMAFILLL